MTVLKKNLEYEREKNNELQHEIEDKEVEINHLEKYREEKIVELSKKVLDQTNLYADLESKINTFVYTIEKKNKEENRIIKKLNQQLRDVINKFKILEQELSETIDLTEKLG
ncbi:uncharacterized protein LOC126906765 isoform X3 [Daktulosphaira vitifoliae]|nr:uncharacterized protein LOC126906765 isoform X3 [Daktulosphaira vitifoliae]XP_050543558.1 uncharacterized protein LOC126906765 isoform X3 [Daktulosphaira vitifoliae]XP_050543559.1 uncharacterized protein LOC126906765 isoform X3 [Daktulosphaira vitifoliae]XP_050543560.1 uncharacterized protein LOC126906765 isoform X3 [Daktulosphaira vitifoliae]XP_050543561.1 uncharacterized protein LOC126906765 isoform X3 [Daktulosphaira vitifoliae]